MGRLPAIEDCFQDSASDAGAASFPRRTGWKPDGTGWAPRPVGRWFQGANSSCFSPAFALRLAGFRRAFSLFFLHNILIYNGIVIFSPTGRPSGLPHSRPALWPAGRSAPVRRGFHGGFSAIEDCINLPRRSAGRGRIGVSPVAPRRRAGATQAVDRVRDAG